MHSARNNNMLYLRCIILLNISYWCRTSKNNATEESTKICFFTSNTGHCTSYILL